MFGSERELPQCIRRICGHQAEEDDIALVEDALISGDCNIRIGGSQRSGLVKFWAVGRLRFRAGPSGRPMRLCAPAFSTYVSGVFRFIGYWALVCGAGIELVKQAPSARQTSAIGYWRAQLAAIGALLPGSEHNRVYVGPPAQFDFKGATQFALLFALGLREEHTVLDVGAGLLRAGRLALQFLLPGRYVAVGPNRWLWRDALASETGEDVVRLKAPQFAADDTFSLTRIGRRFD